MPTSDLISLDNGMDDAEIMARIQDNGRYIYYVRKTPRRCLAAVQQTGDALQFIPKDMQTYEICLAAVSNYGRAIKYVSKKILCDEICMAAVKNDGVALSYIPEKFHTYELYAAAVKQDGWALCSVPEHKRDAYLCTLAVSQNGLALQFVPGNRKTKTLCSAAISNNAAASQFVPKRFEILCPSSLVLEPEQHLIAREVIRKAYIKETRKFVVEVRSGDKNANEIVEFETFEDFYNYLSGDIYGAALYDYDFVDIPLSKYNIDGAIISSETLYQQGLYDDSFYNATIGKYSDEIVYTRSLDNEKTYKASLTLHESDLVPTADICDRKIYYISDIHLSHKLLKRFPERAMRWEIEQWIEDFVDKMVSTVSNDPTVDYLLVAGDVSFNFEVSSIFYSAISKRWPPSKIIVVLGNHELWDFDHFGKAMGQEGNVESIIRKYRELFASLDIIFLYNELFILYSEHNPFERRSIIVSEDQLHSMSTEQLKDYFLKSSLIVLGGLGFSGYKADFNATHGIYRQAICTIEQDIEQTKKFESIYSTVRNVLSDFKVVVLTHTPKDNWSRDDYVPKWIYVNGHTHRNDYCQDERCTFYADNQIGYYNSSIGLKFFFLSGNYDVFRYYSDGIYRITREQYLAFNLGMNISMSFNRSNGEIYMLKNTGLYCFIFKHRYTSKLYLLNGGSLKTLDHNSLQYYFNNMLCYSYGIKKLVGSYYDSLRRISRFIKAIGGTGEIHGCIIDIDLLNHVYVSPNDGSITSYHADSIVDKWVYGSFEMLLKEELPEDLLLNYRNLLLCGNDIAMQLNENAIVAQRSLPQYFGETFMYGPSRIMRSLQYLMDTNVIRRWSDKVLELQVDIDNSLQVIRP